MVHGLVFAARTPRRFPAGREVVRNRVTRSSDRSRRQQFRQHPLAPPACSSALAVAIALGAWAAAASAQPGTEELAPGPIPGLAPLSEVLVLETLPMDVGVAVAAASAESLAGGPVRFASPFAVDVSTTSHGRWEVSSDGRTAVWRLRVVSDGAVSLNLGFDRYRMPPGGRLRIHTPAGDEVLVRSRTRTTRRTASCGLRFSPVATR